MFAIPPQASGFDQNWNYWAGGFTVDELKKIIRLGDKAGLRRAATGGAKKGAALTEKRDSSVAWISPAKDTSWLFERLCKQAYVVNAQHFGFDLFGLVDNLQYTVYEAKGGQHYDWHRDCGGANDVPRKLSFSMLLNDPMDFEGGELWHRGLKEEVLPKARGVVYFFSGLAQHRVTPVTSGVRRSLVGWIAGPRWR